MNMIQQEHQREHLRQYRKSHREAGLCLKCSEKAQQDDTLCRYHREQAREYGARSAAKLKQAGA